MGRRESDRERQKEKGVLGGGREYCRVSGAIKALGLLL